MHSDTAMKYFIHTKEAGYLETLKKIADYFIANIPESKLIPVDIRQPETPAYEDSTAAAIVSCGLLELAKYLPENEKVKYEDAAEYLLNSIFLNMWEAMRSAGNCQKLDGRDLCAGHLPVDEQGRNMGNLYKGREGLYRGLFAGVCAWEHCSPELAPFMLNFHFHRHALKYNNQKVAKDYNDKQNPEVALEENKKMIKKDSIGKPENINKDLET